MSTYDVCRQLIIRVMRKNHGKNIWTEQDTENGWLIHYQKKEDGKYSKCC